MKTHSPPSPPLCFGVFELDPRAGELRKKGMKVRLQGQPVEILVMLLERPGETVTREDLQRKLWPADTFVDFEQGLNNAIKRLRAALDDDPEAPRFVQTLPRRGYRFIGSLHPSRVSGADPSPTRRLGPGLRKTVLGTLAAIIVVSAVLLVLGVFGWPNWVFTRNLDPPVHALAVLPLTNLSDDPEQEYFADGMTEALITELARSGSLQVISRTSSMHYKGSHEKLPEIAKELNVDVVVEGTVARSGDSVRIDVQLIQANTDNHLWAHGYERDMGDILQLQDEVARGIAGEIQAELRTERTSPRVLASVNPQAHELYLKGLFYSSKLTKEGLDQGINYFRESLKVQPGSALAYAGIAESYCSLADLEFLSPVEAYEQADQAAKKALQIDDSNAAAHSSLAWVKYEYEWDRVGAEKEFKRALELNPGDPTTRKIHGFFLMRGGRIKEALEELEKARQIDPLSTNINAAFGLAYYFSHQYSQAIQTTLNVLEMDASFEHARRQLIFLYELNGDLNAAIQEQRKSEILYGKTTNHAVHTADLLDEALARQGPHGYWRRRIELTKHSGAQNAFARAELYLHSGDVSQTLHWLDQAVDDRSVEIDLDKDPQFEGLYGNPHFQEVVRRIRPRTL